MKSRTGTKSNRFESVFLGVCVFLCLLFSAACSELEKPKPAPFYAETPPPKKEFRWSNGKMPKSFDPAKAFAPPETDVVRAVYEGLTEIEPVTLKAIPAVAASWSAAENFRVWTFNLRDEAKWSNGKPVTAHDFVRAWKRLSENGDRVSHRHLLQNIVGIPFKEELKEEEKAEPPGASPELSGFLLNQLSAQKMPAPNPAHSDPAVTSQKNTAKEPESAAKIEIKEAAARKKIDKRREIKFGVEAVGDHVLKVSLIASDKDFPSLVAHPIFRPIFGDGEDFASSEKPNAGIVTNGAFRIVSVGSDGVTLDRAENYWNKEQVTIERVRFVPTENAEKALEAYRAGEIDAVTNVEFAPLALKLLTPYEDFRQTTHSAINFYEFNRAQPIFADRRVREALAIAIERERLTEGDLEGASEPAYGFSPFHESASAQIVQNKEKARQLLAEAGFQNGENFPALRLVVNRNDVQQRVARSVAKMWKQNLNVETEIIVKDAAEIETAKKNGDFDLIRRGVVLPTTDTAANMLAIFEPRKIIVELPEVSETPPNNFSENESETPVSDDLRKNKIAEKEPTEVFEPENGALVLNEAEAIAELSAIPLYFPTSYSLVKPYILGFETNTLDAPLLREVRIDNDWQPKENKGESK